ncbi:MAG: hypothetical protein M5U01_10360 [Ardenticatenaceae bacterium]|nr:hypothetical protein [Ardenticatenaceae bacterium]
MSLKSPLLVVATVLVLAAATCFLATREVSLGQATFAGPLNISGGGSAAAPALILAGDGDTGLYRSGANTLAVAAGGSQQLSLSSSGATFPNGLTVSGGSLTVSGATVDVPAGGVAWAAVDKSGSAIADLATRSAAELDSGTLPDARLSGNVPLVGAKLHTVCASGCDYTNPADAYAAAASGDTLWIAPGTYTATGAWTVNKSVTIDAYGVTFAPAAYSGEFAFHVSSAVALRIFGLTVVGTGDALGRATTVVQVDHAGAVVTLRDVDFTGGADGGGGAGWGSTSTAAPSRSSIRRSPAARVARAAPMARPASSSMTAPSRCGAAPPSRGAGSSRAATRPRRG